jgi:hypothetical protein
MRVQWLWLLMLVVALGGSGAFAQVIGCPTCTNFCQGFQTGVACHDGTTGCNGTYKCDSTSRVVYCGVSGDIACPQCGAGGFQTCSNGAGIHPVLLSACRPPPPFHSETCNGCDDNVNGTVDEGLTTSCTLSNGCSGVSTCTNGSYGACQLAVTSTRPCSSCAGGAQTCNANGTFGTCQPPTAQSETCNSCDDDRDGVVDNNLPTECILTSGCSGKLTCSRGIPSCGWFSGSKRPCANCVGGGSQTCDRNGGFGICQSTVRNDEVCNNCDDDRDGLVDDVPASGCTQANGCSGSTVCMSGTTSCQWSAGSTRPCANCVGGGAQTCASNDTFGICTASTIQTEACNNCDDDRDGIIDDSVPNLACTMGDGCSGARICNRGQFSACGISSTSARSCTECGPGGSQVCYGSMIPGQPATGYSECRPQVSRPEVCDRCDDNRDGSLAATQSCEWVGGCSTRECVGTTGTWGECSPPRQEACNGLDDTCDDLIDEGSACRASTACACVPTTQCPTGFCGAMPDGCGGIVSCTRNHCMPSSCGAIDDGCGGSLSCPLCVSPLVCGGDGRPNVCGVVPGSECALQGGVVCPSGYPCCTTDAKWCNRDCPIGINPHPPPPEG